MQKFISNTKCNLSQNLFEQYPWAANHDDAISCITRYMDNNVESIVQRLDERILNKVAKDHFVFSGTGSFA